jgi:flagellar motor switch protein FliN
MIDQNEAFAPDFIEPEIVQPASSLSEPIAGAHFASAPQLNRPVRAPERTHETALMSIPVKLDIILARTRMPAAKVLALNSGVPIDLDHFAGGEVEVLANGQRIAFGHLYLADEATRRVGVRISRLASGTNLDG